MEGDAYMADPEVSGNLLYEATVTKLREATRISSAPFIEMHTRLAKSDFAP